MLAYIEEVEVGNVNFLHIEPEVAVVSVDGAARDDALELGVGDLVDEGHHGFASLAHADEDSSSRWSSLRSRLRAC
jgi:hypothetical protein